MALSDKQFRILSVIDQGNTTGESIADALGTTMQMLRYYLDTMSEDGYIKTAKVYDNGTRDFMIVRAYLTDKGKSTLEQVPPSRGPQPEPAKSESVKVAAVEPLKPAVKQSVPLSPSVKPVERSTTPQAGIQDIDEILQSLDVLQRVVDELPEERREVISVYLTDLQDEIKIVYRRKAQRIKAYFLAVLGTTLPIVKQTEQGQVFLEHTRRLSQKLNIPVKLPA
jgi:DeoR family transcriptional regulator, catabolite repression regulator